VNKPQTGLPYCTNIVPNIKLLLQIFTTLSVTAATQERTFTTSKQLKIYLRSTMTENRLNGLALIIINKEKVISASEIIEDFNLQIGHNNCIKLLLIYTLIIFLL
jgi:hypothetical protein